MGVKLANRNKGIFIYGITDAKAEKIEMLSKGLRLECKRIPDCACNEKIGSIVGQKPIKPIQSDNSKMSGGISEVLLFNGLSDGELDVFLREYRNAGIEPVGLKAIVTPDNSVWTLNELITELIKERAAIALQRR